MNDIDIKKVKRQYYYHNGNARKRNVEFNLTFDEWLNIWIDSGKLHERGCHKGQYVMSRFDDIGPYEIGNVFIQLCTDNINDYRNNNPHHGSGRIVSIETKRKLSLPQPIVECPHCGKTGGLKPMKQWHFNNCKLNILNMEK